MSSDLLFLCTDLQDLKATGKVWVLMNSDSQEEIVYPNDPKIVITVLKNAILKS